VIAADHDRGRERAVAHHLIEAQPEPMPLAVAQPADPRRQTLEAHVLLRQRDPAVQPPVFRKFGERRGVGGGVGMGYSQHAGVVIVCDGTEAAAKRIERVLWNDPASGVMRHADAGYARAIEVAREKGLKLPMLGR